MVAIVSAPKVSNPPSSFKKMNRYSDSEVKCELSAYEFGDDWIHIEFNHGVVYEYTYDSAGSHNVEMMKRLAETGHSLNNFVHDHVRHKYSRRVR